jgi:transposase
VECHRHADLSAFLDGAKAVEGTVGKKALSPRMKLTLWLYAISTGVGSAREIARLIKTDDAYRWIVGDLEVGHHALSAFRVKHGAALDGLMTDILASLLHIGVLSLDLVAQDGIRIRAAATAPSFRGQESLLQCQEQAALHLKAVLAQADDPQIIGGGPAGLSAALVLGRSRKQIVLIDGGRPRNAAAQQQVHGLITRDGIVHPSSGASPMTSCEATARSTYAPTAARPRSCGAAMGSSCAWATPITPRGGSRCARA